ncbi:hypothetical protein ACN19N_09050 [Acinetobacter sp. LF10]|uniref:hypothetical protein n=1 Tax=Acinetobacter sp. LF10 TaxID=3403576 RepID=UPI003B22873E
MSTEVSAATSGLIWGMPDEKKRVFLDKSWKRLATTAPNIFKRYQSCDDPVLAFLRDFFPSSSQSYTSFLSNVALKNWRNKANIAFRIPNHPLFSALLPDNSCISVTVHCSTDSYYPLSFPSNIFLTHNDAQATSYEHKIDLYSTESSIGQRTKLKNVISTSLVEQMPAVSLEAYNKLKLWENFQDFKENLIIEKAVGLKYIDLRIDFKNSVLKALVVAENKEQLIRMRKALARKTIFLSNISLSADAWSFRLAESNGSYFDKKTHEMVEFGQLKGRLDTKVIIPLADTVGYVRYLQETPEQWIQPVTTWVDIELSDEWIKKLDEPYRVCRRLFYLS